MVGPKRIATRIRELEAKLKGAPRRACPECGAEDGGPVITERHTLDATRIYEPCEPCSGCAKLAPPGVIRRILICAPHSHALECPFCGPAPASVVERKKHLRERGIYGH